MQPFYLGLTDRHLRVILCISRNETVLQICLRSATMFLGSTIKQRKWFSCLQYKILLNSYSKGLILTNFRGRMDRHLRGILSISRDENAFYICLRHVTMCP